MSEKNNIFFQVTKSKSGYHINECLRLLVLVIKCCNFSNLELEGKFYPVILPPNSRGVDINKIFHKQKPENLYLAAKMPIKITCTNLILLLSCLCVLLTGPRGRPLSPRMYLLTQSLTPCILAYSDNINLDHGLLSVKSNAAIAIALPT